MKKALFLLLLIFMHTALSAQEDLEHMTFKGVPINGTLNECVQKLKQVGFSQLAIEDGRAMLQGEFAGYKECIVGVLALEVTNTVNTIAVLFPEHEEWSSLEKNYALLKSMLTTKYGKPSNCIEKFQGYGTPQNDGEKLLYLKMDNCIYNTDFETSKGNILLSIEHEDFTSCFIKLQYWDKINTEAAQLEVMDDL